MKHLCPGLFMKFTWKLTLQLRWHNTWTNQTTPPPTQIISPFGRASPQLPAKRATWSAQLFLVRYASHSVSTRATSKSTSSFNRRDLNQARVSRVRYAGRRSRNRVIWNVTRGSTLVRNLSPVAYATKGSHVPTTWRRITQPTRRKSPFLEGSFRISIFIIKTQVQ